MYRNGRRERAGRMRCGEITLPIPQLCTDTFPNLVEPRSRSEKALVAVVPNPQVNGVSTRKVEHREPARPVGMSASIP
jgi:transposase-like protein